MNKGPPLSPDGPLINFKYLFDFPLFFLNPIWIFFLIFNFCSYSEDSGIPGIPAFRHSGIPAFFLYQITRKMLPNNERVMQRKYPVYKRTTVYQHAAA